MMPTTQTLPTVDVALTKLTQSHIEQSWKDLVTDNNSYLGLGKLFGMAVYVLNMRENRKKDETVILFKEKLSAFVYALSLRNLTPAEAGGRPLVHNSGAQRQIDMQQELHANKAEEEFYKVFKTRCQQCSVSENSPEFRVFSKAALKAVANFVEEKGNEVKFAALMPLKLQTVSTNFDGRIYNDMVTAYGKQDVATLTHEGFVKRANEIHAFFPNTDIRYIHDAMKAAVRADEANQAKAAELADKYGDLSDGNQLLKDLKTNLETDLKAQLTDVHAKMHVLIGDRGNNGKINEAHEKIAPAKRALDEALKAFRTAAAGAGTIASYSTVDQVLSIADLTGTLASAAVQTAHEAVKDKAAALKAAEKAKTDLVAELEPLAEWDNGNIVGGKEHELQNKIANIGQTAKDTSTANAGLFRWLAAN